MYDAGNKISRNSKSKRNDVVLSNISSIYLVKCATFSPVRISENRRFQRYSNHRAEGEKTRKIPNSRFAKKK